MPPSFIFFLLATCLPTVWLVDQKALDEFVKFPDPHYNYTSLFATRSIGYFFGSFNIINLTSQKWLDESEVDKPIWSHKLTIVVPRRRSGTSCLLVIRPEESEKSFLNDLSYRTTIILAAEYLRSVVAMFRPLPNQPLTFYDHPLGHKNITGYDIFAYSWWKFLNDPTAPPHWLVQFPMVKATVRAMDTVIDYTKKKYGLEITNFILEGISMGGWISWLTAAVDKRVQGIVPIGMDFLNFTESFHHQFRAYCGWSYKLRPFYEMNITQELDNPRFSELASHVDPLAYNERYKDVGKLIIVFSWDELFPPDNSRYYFSQLKGVKYLRIIPKQHDELKGLHHFANNVAAFFFELVEKKNGLPTISWEIKTTNTSVTISVRAYNVHRVYSYHADIVDSTRRDFRMSILAGNSSQENPLKWIRNHLVLPENPVKWIKTGLQEVVLERDVYTFEMQKPEKGWRAFFVEVIYPYDLIVTSEMHIMPDTFPCPDCNGEECRGTLV